MEGGSLDQRIAESPTSPRAAAEFVETLARTMEVAHQRGIVHRDLKPANILLAKLGSQSSIVRSRETDSSSLPADHWSRTTVPKIADFGLAKRVDDDSSQTKSGTILGTPSYMAPEQAGGKNREIGPAVDIYSLGAILYELLVGRPPFKAGNPIDTIRQVIEQEPVPPRQLEPRVPHDLETICLKCLEKDPARRFATAAELADDLRRFVDGDPILPGRRRPGSVPGNGANAGRPSWRCWQSAALAVIGMVLFIVWHNVSLRGELDVALAEERRARQREHERARGAAAVARCSKRGRSSSTAPGVAVAAGDWSSARLDLEKALTTDRQRGAAGSLQGARGGPAQAGRARTARRGRPAGVSRPLPVVRRHARRSPVPRHAVHRHGPGRQPGSRAHVGPEGAGRLWRRARSRRLGPGFDAYLSDAQKAEILADCSQLLLILAETEAQSASDGRGRARRNSILRKALGFLEQARRLGAPSSGLSPAAGTLPEHARRLSRSGSAEKAAQGAALDEVLDHFLMADELYRREKFGEAIKEFDQVLERKPGHFWAQYLNAICLLRQQRPAEARALLERLSGSAIRFRLALSAAGLRSAGAAGVGRGRFRLPEGLADAPR